MGKLKLISDDWRTRDGRARAVRLLRQTLCKIERGSLKVEQLLIITRSPEVPGTGEYDYETRSNYMTNGDALWLLERAKQRILG